MSALMNALVRPGNALVRVCACACKVITPTLVGSLAALTGAFPAAGVLSEQPATSRPLISKANKSADERKYRWTRH